MPAKNAFKFNPLIIPLIITGFVAVVLNWVGFVGLFEFSLKNHKKKVFL